MEKEKQLEQIFPFVHRTAVDTGDDTLSSSSSSSFSPSIETNSNLVELEEKLGIGAHRKVRLRWLRQRRRASLARRSIDRQFSSSFSSFGRQMR